VPFLLLFCGWRATVNRVLSLGAFWAPAVGRLLSLGDRELSLGAVLLSSLSLPLNLTFVELKLPSS
jgi:hypothetical protein